jgi:hypothetical protein
MHLRAGDQAWRAPIAWELKCVSYPRCNNAKINYVHGEEHLRPTRACLMRIPRPHWKPPICLLIARRWWSSRTFCAHWPASSTSESLTASPSPLPYGNTGSPILNAWPDRVGGRAIVMSKGVRLTQSAELQSGRAMPLSLPDRSRRTRPPPWRTPLPLPRLRVKSECSSPGPW